MAIRYRPDRKKFEAAITLRGKRIRKAFDSKKDAKEFIRDVELRKLNLDGLDSLYTLDAAFSSFIDTESSQKTPRSAASDKRFLGLALSFFKDRNLETVDQITFEDLQFFQIWAAKAQKTATLTKAEWSQTTVSHCTKLLKQVFKKLLRTGRIKKNPAEHWKVPCGTGERRRPMSQDEFTTLYNAAHDWFKPILKFIRLTGARGASVADLTWGDVDFEAKSIVLRSRKGGIGKIKTIVLPLYDELFEFLKDHMREKRMIHSIFPRSAPLFKNKIDHPITADQISSYGHQLIKKCKLNGLVIYSLRHAIAVDMTKAGVSLEITRQGMGHSNIAQTSDYARGINIDAVGEAFNRIRSNSAKKIVPPSDTSE